MLSARELVAKWRTEAASAEQRGDDLERDIACGHADELEATLAPDHIVMVPVDVDLLPKLGEWSAPLHIMLETLSTGHRLIMRQPDPAPTLLSAVQRRALGALLGMSEGPSEYDIVLDLFASLGLSHTWETTTARALLAADARMAGGGA